MYHILVVDDALVSLNAVRNCLQDSYELTLVRSGRDALAALCKRKVDVILLDYDMPEMDGLETLKKIRCIEKALDIPVFFLTGHSDKDTVMKCLEAGAVGYLIKPIKKEMIEKRLWKFFRDRQNEMSLLDDWPVLEEIQKDDFADF